MAQDDTIISCPRCDTDNPVASDICYRCGAPLHAAPGKKSRRRWPLAVMLLFWAGAFFFYYHSWWTNGPVSAPSASVPAASSLPAAKNPPVPDSRAARTAADIPARPSPLKLVTGRVVIKNIAGQAIARVPAAVLADGWVALPTGVCLGGFEWILQTAAGAKLPLVAGILSTDEVIGLWRVPANVRLEGTALQPWSADKPLKWLAIAAAQNPEPVSVQVVADDGDFIRGRLAGGGRQAGVLVQGGHVVGWSGGQLGDRVFLWNGGRPEALHPAIRVEDYYHDTFADSREEELTRALAMGPEYTDLQRLQALAGAFRLAPRLSEKSTPVRLRTDAVVTRMRSFIARALQAGFATDVADIFDAPILIQAADIPLALDVARATAAGYGFEDALDLTESVENGLPSSQNSGQDRLEELRARLFRDWIGSLLENDDLVGARQAYERGRDNFPDDPEIHLAGVALALAEGNWSAAEQQLRAREYPPALNSRVKELQARIAELQGETAEVVVHFTPGTRHIPVTAVINGEIQQEFIVDTGASMVTIPSATAQRLGLAMDASAGQRRVATAGGEKYAPEVLLSSITVEGWQTDDIKALVLDIPDQPALGLLGLNYLHRFHMEIDSEKGMLTLQPR